MWCSGPLPLEALVLGTLGQFKIKVAPDLVKTFNKNKKGDPKSRQIQKSKKKSQTG